MIVNGGLVQEVSKFPGRDIRYAVKGVWSGGEWKAENKFPVFQFRNHVPVDKWDTVGVERISGKSDMLLILKPTHEGSVLQPDDVVIFGEGHYTSLQVKVPNFPDRRACAIEFGPSRSKAIALRTEGRVDHIIVFHELGSPLSEEREQVFLWRKQEYTAEILAINDRPLSSYFVELTFKKSQSSIRKLVDILKPVSEFILDAGQEMFTNKPYTGGRRRDDTYKLFEPSTTVLRGSVKIVLTPQEIFIDDVNTDEPLRLLTEIFDVAVEGNPINFDTVPSLERVKSVDRLLRIASQIAEQTKDSKGLIINAPNLKNAITIDRAIYHTIRSSIDHPSSRVVRIIGTLESVDFIRNRCEIVNREGDHWKLTFSDDQVEEVQGAVPRKVSVVFRTNAPKGTQKGVGELLEIEG